MLLRPDGDAVVAIGQASHAWVSGQLARAWRDVEPREEVCLAAEQHDVGMAHWDLAPALNPSTGRPQSFMEMPLEVHLALWSAAPQRLLTQSRDAALLVSLHGTALYERRDLDRLSAEDADAVRAYLAGQRALQERLAGEVGASAEDRRRNQALLWAWDWLSLALLLDWAPSSLEGAVPLAIAPAGGGAVTVDPWPFDPAELRVRCDGRRLEGRYEDERSLHAALERAPYAPVEVALRPA